MATYFTGDGRRKYTYESTKKIDTLDGFTLFGSLRRSQNSALYLSITMKTTLCLLALSSAAAAFVPVRNAPRAVAFRSLRAEDSPEDVPAAATDDRPKEPSISESPFDAGSEEELLYALGVNLARQIGDVRPLVESSDELALVAKGLLDTVIGRLEEEGQAMLLSRRKGDLSALVTERATKIRDRLVEAGNQMLKDMKETDGARELASGVILHVLDFGPEGEGEGVRPTKQSSVKVHYHGTLPDGTVFDSTLGGDPAQFALGQVIPGWCEALLSMHEGETAMVGIPPEQAYGDNGSPDGAIPGGATIFFKIQLKEVVTAGIGGSPTLVGVDGKALKKNDGESTGLLGADGKPL